MTASAGINAGADPGAEHTADHAGDDVARPWLGVYPPRLRTFHPSGAGGVAHPADLAAAVARVGGDRPAFSVVLPDGTCRTLGFAEVDRLSNAFAAYLRHDARLRTGDVVAIQLPNTLHYPVATFAAWKAGLILTLVNPLYTLPEVERQLADSGAKLVIVADTFAQACEAATRDSGIPLVVARQADFDPEPAVAGPGAADGRRTLFADALARHKGANDPGQRQDIVLYQYTGGTTGRSKAAVTSAANVLASLAMIRAFLESFDGELRGATTLTVLPLYHIFAFVMGFLFHFEGGSHTVLMPSPRPLENLRPAFARFRIDWMAGVDTLFAGLLAEPWFREDPPRLRYALSGGTAIRPATVQSWEAAVGPLFEGYGLTESTCIVTANPPNADRRPGSVGVPLPGCDVRIVRDDGTSAPPGEPGELTVRGPQIVAGYRDQPAENAAAFVDGWFRTGDIARMSADGFVEIVDRKKDMILVSGFNVYPTEVEEALVTHAGVVEAAVVGAPDDRTGEAVTAFVVVSDAGLAPAALIDHVRSRLAAYKVPNRLVVVSELPKSPVGKVLRAALRARA